MNKRGGGPHIYLGSPLWPRPHVSATLASSLHDRGVDLSPMLQPCWPRPVVVAARAPFSRLASAAISPVEGTALYGSTSPRSSPRFGPIAATPFTTQLAPAAPEEIYVNKKNPFNPVSLAAPVGTFCIVGMEPKLTLRPAHRARVRDCFHPHLVAALIFCLIIIYALLYLQL